jgi:UDP-glucose 4-epimerase
MHYWLLNTSSTDNGQSGKECLQARRGVSKPFVTCSPASRRRGDLHELLPSHSVANTEHRKVAA